MDATLPLFNAQAWMKEMSMATENGQSSNMTVFEHLSLDNLTLSHETGRHLIW